MFFFVLGNLEVLISNWSEDCSATDPDWGAAATCTSAACAFLAPWLFTTTTNFMSDFSFSGCLSLVSLFYLNGVEHCLLMWFNTEDFSIEVHLGDFFASHVKDFNTDGFLFCHNYCSPFRSYSAASVAGASSTGAS